MDINLKKGNNKQVSKCSYSVGMLHGTYKTMPMITRIFQ